LPEGVVRTLREELAWAVESLTEVGCDTPRLDAELLLCEVLGCDRAGLVVRRDDALNGDQRTRYLALLTRRCDRDPIAYILRRKEFRRLTLAVDPRALIPRPETELLVEVGLALPAGIRVADVGTGSGAVALALKDERPDLDVTGIELQAGALSLARANGSRLRLEVSWVQSDLLDDGVYDAVLANLPYVRDDEVLPPDVAAYEPPAALLGGYDGLDVIRRLCDQVSLRQDVQLMALEIGSEQGEAVAALVSGAGFDSVEVLKDLAGLDRVVVGGPSAGAGEA
jgi:release factor glutamine methyltransferase